MTYHSLERLRRHLYEQRYSLSRLQEHAVSDAAELRSEREPDWPDAAALATSVSTLESLGDSERAAIIRIDEALARMERGTYGECVSCGAPIDSDRLEAAPEADRCARCAER